MINPINTKLFSIHNSHKLVDNSPPQKLVDVPFPIFVKRININKTVRIPINPLISLMETELLLVAKSVPIIKPKKQSIINKIKKTGNALAIKE